MLTDLTGQTGLRIVRSILTGERDPERLAAYRDHRCHASHAEIVAALTGNYRTEHLSGARFGPGHRNRPRRVNRTGLRRCWDSIAK